MTKKLDGIRLVFMGTPEFAVSSLEALAEAGATITGVVTAPDKPAGRGKKMQASPVKQWAAEHLSCPILQPEKLRDPSFLEALRHVRADMFVVVAFRMLPEAVWTIPQGGTFNLHASLLPDYRGAAPINHALMNGETLTGVSTFMIDHAIDTGNILLRKEVPIDPDDNAGTLHDKLMETGAQLVIETVAGLAAGTLSARPQSAFTEPGMSLHQAPKINRDDCRIEWSRSASDLRNFIRGLSPYPSAWTLLQLPGKEAVLCKIPGVSLVDARCDAPPGTISSDDRTFIRVACGDGCLELHEIQPAGKRKMKTDEFLRGLHGGIDGSRFE